MGALDFASVFDKAEMVDAARPALREVAEGIRDRAAARFRFSRHQNRARFWIEDTEEGVNVSLDSSFGHLDEWGGPKSRPSGAMRSAAAEAGEFTPEGAS